MRKHRSYSSIQLLLLALAITLPSASPALAAPYWIASWAASPTPAPAAGSSQGGAGASLYQNQTVREIVHLTEGGEQIRVRLTNRYGVSPLTIGAATMALRAQGSTISPDTLQTLTFNTQPTATIPPGADLISDPVSMLVGPQADIAVSLYLPNSNPAASIHQIQRSAIYTALENQASAASFPPSTAASDGQPWVWLDEVDVTSVTAVPVIVTFGDSITDGYQITRDSAHDWPDILSQRLQQAHRPGAVVNAGIGGNRILRDGPSRMISFGANALARFDDDVLAQSGVHTVIVLLGINDIGLGLATTETVTAQDIEGGLTQIALRAHAHGLKIYVGTLTPFAATPVPGYYSPEKEQERQAVNTWIRGQQGRYDGVIDFDKAVRDPAHPAQMLPAYDSGDHLHPNDNGAQAMANAISLDLLK